MKITNATTGQEVVLVPTSSDEKLRQHHEAKAKAEKRAAAIDAEQARAKAKRYAALPTPIERMEAATEGLRKIAQKMDRQGDPRGDKVLEIVDEAVDALHSYVELSRQLQERQVDPLDAAIASSARELRKALPKTFPTENDATLFARKLPLTKARNESVRAADARGKLSHQRNRTAFSFWATIQRGAARAGLAADDRILDYLVNLGDF